jgi:hypothetical protein
MAINGLGRVVLTAFAVCVLAVALALLVPHILSSAPAHAFLEWLTAPPDMPCACGPTFSNG